MSPSLPVPSKGALRALRRLALGTSCTVAFGAGLITEDRRRRIHTAREASENARRLKASRKYHSAGVSVATTFEEQVDNYCKYGPWKGGDKQRILDPAWNDAGPSHPPTLGKNGKVDGKTSLNISESTLTKTQHSIRKNTKEMTNLQAWIPVGHSKIKERKPYSLLNPDEISEDGDANDKVIWKPTTMEYVGESAGSVPRNMAAHVNICEVPQSTTSPSIGKWARTQTQLAMQISNILRDQGGNGITKVGEAVSAFHAAFQGLVSAEVISRELLDACMLLAQECDFYGKLDLFTPVLSKLLSCGYPIDEKSLQKLHAAKVIALLLQQSGYRHADQEVSTNANKLKQAVAIFIAKTNEKPKALPEELRDVGLQLCSATLRGNLYELTEAVYWRLLCNRMDFTAPEVECLILAEHRRGFWDQVLHHFSRYFSRTAPNQIQLYSVVSAAIDSALELGRIDAAEEILSTASLIAGNENLRTSTKWYLRVLGEHWRATRDIKTTQALFKRLEVLLKQTSRPQALYSAMIQFCIEAGSESEAQQYLQRLTKLVNVDNIDVRTYGHLALAKAMKNDWVGVQEDFYFMKKFAKRSIREHSAVFVPILKLFIASHDVGQVEDFVRLYVENLDVAPNQYVFNIMVDMYCKAGELSNIPQWIGYAQQRGLHVDAVTFNTILSRCQKQWAVHPDDLFQLFKKFGPMYDSTTIQILRRAATSSATPRRAERLLRQVKTPNDIKFDKIEAEMSKALELGDDIKVLKTYQFAVRSAKRISHRGFSIAVRASIRSATDGNLTSTIEIITNARTYGFDILPSVAHLLLHQISVSKCHGDDFVSLVKHTLSEFGNGGLPVTLSIASKVISELVSRSKPEEALLLWNTLKSQPHIARQPVDIVILTVLVRAHIMLSDLAGIKDVLCVLVKNNIIPDKQFKLVIKSARQEARRFLNARPDSFNAKQRYEVLDECMRLVTAQRAFGESKLLEAERLTLSMVEATLAIGPGISHVKSTADLSEALHIKRSQRIRNPKKIWERLGKHDKFNRHLGTTNLVGGEQEGLSNAF